MQYIFDFSVQKFINIGLCFLLIFLNFMALWWLSQYSDPPELISPHEKWSLNNVTKPYSDIVRERLMRFNGRIPKDEILKWILTRYPYLEKTALFRHFPKIPLVTYNDFIAWVRIWIQQCEQLLPKTWEHKRKIEQELYGKEEKNISTILKRLNGDIHHLLSEIIHTIVPFVSWEDAEILRVQIGHFKSKYATIGWITMHVELLDMLFINHNPDENTFFGCIPYDMLKELIECILLIHIFTIHLSQTSTRSKAWLIEVATLSSICRNASDCCKHIQVHQVASHFSFWGEKIPEKVLKKYLASDLYKVISWVIEYQDIDGNKKDIESTSWEYINNLLAHGWSFLAEISFNDPLIHLILWVSSDPISPIRKQKILSLRQAKYFKTWGAKEFFTIIFCEAEDHPWIHDADTATIQKLWDVCILEDEGDFDVAINLDFLTEYTFEEVKYLLELGQDAIVWLESGRFAKDDIFWVRKMKRELWMSLSLIPDMHPWKSTLLTFYENIPLYWQRFVDCETGLTTTLTTCNASQIYQVHWECIAAWYSFDDIRNFWTLIYDFVDGNQEQYALIIPRFLWLNREILTRFLDGFPDCNPEIFYAVLQEDLEDFEGFLTRNNCWGEDLWTAYELYIQSKEISQDRGPLVDVSAISTLAVLESIYWENGALIIDSLWFSHEQQIQIIEMWERMSQYFCSSFLFFLENNTAKFQHISNKLYWKIQQIEKILFFFQAYGILILQNPEKLFEFIFFWDIEDLAIDELYDFFDEYDITGKDYWIFVQIVMRYLKHPSRKILTGFISQSWDNNFSVQKISSWYNIATIGFTECRRKLLQSWCIENSWKWGHIKFNKTNEKGETIMIILPHNGDANVNRYIVRGIIKTLHLTREEWHNL